MRVYFVGSHSTGKTTLARAVSKQFGLPLITEVARGVLAELEINFNTLRTDIDMVARYQRKVFERQVATERLQQAGFVSDRAFDNLAYAAEHSNILPDMVLTQEFIKYVETIRQQGIVFFVRPHPNLITEDGTRAGADHDSILRIDGMVKLLLIMNRVEHFNIRGENFQERFNDVMLILKIVAGRPARLKF